MTDPSTWHTEIRLASYIYLFIYLFIYMGFTVSCILDAHEFTMGYVIIPWKVSWLWF
jgi:hypothetical protein